MLAQIWCPVSRELMNKCMWSFLPQVLFVLRVTQVLVDLSIMDLTVNVKMYDSDAGKNIKNTYLPFLSTCSMDFVFLSFTLGRVLASNVRTFIMVIAR